MGFNTTVVLYNDQMSAWPQRIADATTSWSRHDLRHGSFHEAGHFGFGQVIACEHADHDQVCVVGQNYGRYLTSITPVERESDLRVLAEVLRGHGYSVRAPGEKRAKPPLTWGYSAKQQAT